MHGDGLSDATRMIFSCCLTPPLPSPAPYLELITVFLLSLMEATEPSSPVHELAQELNLGEELQLQPFIGRLKIEIIQARGIKPCVEPYIIALYDHSEVTSTCGSEYSTDDEEDGESQGTVRAQERWNVLN